MSADGELLCNYAETGSEDDFSELVRRHLPLVYAAALRQVFGNEALAKDVAQAVFIDLARKAGSLAGRDLLAGWLYTSTRLAASKALRGEHRRQRRERLAAATMQEDNRHPGTEQAELRLVLDDAMSKLSARDRNVLLLRFFQSKDFKGVGAAMGLSEDAARMRVTRALGKLAALMSKRGVALPGGALGMALTAEAATATPAGLAASISLAATTSASAGTAMTALVKLLSATKLKAGVVSAIIIACITTPMLVAHRSSGHGHTQTRTPGRQPTLAGIPGPGAEITRDSQPLAQPVAGRSAPVEREIRYAKLRAEGARLLTQKAGMVNSSAAQAALRASKLSLLKAWLAEMPERNIPEIQLCADEDWLSTATVYNLDTEVSARRALANLRNAAKMRLAKTIIEAVKKYTAVHDRQLPSDLAELKPFMDPRVGDSFLDRYELLGRPGETSAADWAAVEKFTSDGDYDTRHQIGVYGYTVHQIDPVLADTVGKP